MPTRLVELWHRLEAEASQMLDRAMPIIGNDYRELAESLRANCIRIRRTDSNHARPLIGLDRDKRRVFFGPGDVHSIRITGSDGKTEGFVLPIKPEDIADARQWFAYGPPVPHYRARRLSATTRAAPSPVPWLAETAAGHPPLFIDVHGNKHAFAIRVAEGTRWAPNWKAVSVDGDTLARIVASHTEFNIASGTALDRPIVLVSCLVNAADATSAPAFTRTMREFGLRGGVYAPTSDVALGASAESAELTVHASPDFGIIWPLDFLPVDATETFVVRDPFGNVRKLK